MEEIEWNHVFLIDGFILRVIERRPMDLPERVQLSDLKYWRQVAHIHQQTVAETSKRSLIQILNKTKEKCYRGGKPPTIKKCKECLKSAITIEQLEQDRELCLPRIMGLAINQGFDGIHHGHEIADIKYKDTLIENNSEVKIAIHLKSRREPKTQGLGRGVYLIKAVYTQIFFSAYQTLHGDVDFDVIGFSVPNTIKEDVVDSIQVLLNKLGFSMLAIDENDWLKIMRIVQEQLAFE